MSPLPFNLQFIQFLADHRTAPLTRFFLAVTTLGTTNIYILIITLIYVAWNKRLAIRLSVLLLLASSINGIFKLCIKNPRPFVLEGTYQQKWAVSGDAAEGLARGYSTPSGHAMSAATFYGYLHRSVSNRYIKIFAVAAIVLIGLSRPYLGVHYAEDVLSGWAIGLGCALIAAKYLDGFCERWAAVSYPAQVGIAVSASLVLWFTAIVLSGDRAVDEQTAFLADTGFLSGVVIARPLELKFISFNPRSSSVSIRILRYFLTCGLVFATVTLLDMPFRQFSNQAPWLGMVSEYIRFTAAGIVNIFLAPLLFTRLGMAQATPPPSS